MQRQWSTKLPISMSCCGSYETTISNSNSMINSISVDTTLSNELSSINSWHRKSSRNINECSIHMFSKRSWNFLRKKRSLIRKRRIEFYHSFLFFVSCDASLRRSFKMFVNSKDESIETSLTRNECIARLKWSRVNSSSMSIFTTASFSF